MTVPRMALVGAHGFGSVHLERMLRIHGSGRARLVGVADRRVVDGDLPVPQFPSLAAMLDDRAPDIVVISTPIHTHLELARLALTSGADVLVEKPPVTSISDFDLLAEAARDAGRQVQVAFQTLGSTGPAIVRSLMESGAIGTVTGIGAVGLWQRTLGYWRRSPWTGRRDLDGTPVLDGVVANPLAHAVSTSLAVAGCAAATDVSGIDLDLYHAAPIEADDTSSVVITSRDGMKVGLALTLAAPAQLPPWISVFGDTGRIDYYYEEDRIVVSQEGSKPVSYRAVRTNLLENLLDHRCEGTSLLSPLSRSGAFVAVLDAVRRWRLPRAIDQSQVEWRGAGGERHAVVRGIERWARRAAERQATFAQLGAPWAAAVSRVQE
ncbi:MAG TPA: Gfo/Idh/MocA family oxidoreductase [Microbacterium sp.]|uniref:Gfo/Idh/MocA family protein n=2 Tax=unclassified Microbacterium TaxID=2609290 RepID=UPI002F9365EF